MAHSELLANHMLCSLYMQPLLAPAVTVGETEGAMDSTSFLFFTSSFAYNFAKKQARITIFDMWVTSRWLIDRLKYF